MSLKQRFVAALRSGKYEKGVGRLKAGECFCAQGILLDVVAPEGWQPADTWVYGDTCVYTPYIPNVLGEQLGLSAQELDALLVWNDSLGLSFRSIADKIEENWTDA